MSIGLQLRYQILKRDRFFCQLCGASPKDAGVELEVDHIIPVSKSGTNLPQNLQTLCMKCNRGKSNYLPDPVETLIEDRFSDSNVRIAFEIWYRDLNESERVLFGSSLNTLCHLKKAKGRFLKILEEYWSYPWRFQSEMSELDPPWFQYADIAWTHGTFQVALPNKISAPSAPKDELYWQITSNLEAHSITP